MSNASDQKKPEAVLAADQSVMGGGLVTGATGGCSARAAGASGCRPGSGDRVGSGVHVPSGAWVVPGSGVRAPSGVWVVPGTGGRVPSGVVVAPPVARPVGRGGGTVYVR